MHVIVLAPGVGEPADGLDILPLAGVEGVLGMGDGRAESSASKVKITGLTQGAWMHLMSTSSALRLLTTGGVVSTSKRSLSLNAVRASPGLCEGASDATTLMRYPPSGRRLASKE